ncbi:MAG: KH domain-containing protein [Desulfotomaculales bacterium]
MKQLVEILARSLVDRPEEVRVNLQEQDRRLVIELKVAPEDMGKVIGKQGRVAKAMRAVVKAAATRRRKKVTLEIV